MITYIKSVVITTISPLGGIGVSVKNVQRLTDKEMGELGKLATQYQAADKLTWIAALEKAQSELFSVEKRYTKGSLYSFSTKIRENIPKENEITVSSTIEAAVETQPVVQPEAVIQPEAEKVEYKIPEIKHVPAFANFSFGTKITELASVLAKQFEDTLTTELEQALVSAMTSVERSFEEKMASARKIAGVTKKQLPRVMVIGVMGEVAYETNSEYGDMLDLRFYKIEENVGLIRAQAKNCDYVILITKHISHNHQDCVREHPGLIYCNGGVTQMKEILLNLACK